MRTVLDTTVLEWERSNLPEELLVASELMQNSIYKNARIALDQEEYQKRYGGLSAYFDKTKVRPEMAEPALWGELLDFVTVCSKDDVRFTFKGETEINA